MSKRKFQFGPIVSSAPAFGPPVEIVPRTPMAEIVPRAPMLEVVPRTPMADSSTPNKRRGRR